MRFRCRVRVEFKMVFSNRFLAGLFMSVTASALTPSAMGATPCANCSVTAAQKMGAQVMNPQGEDLGINVASILAKSGMVPTVGQVPTGLIPKDLPRSQSMDSEIPNAFQRPWDFAPSRFDPSFTTSYYTSEQGVILDSPDAPWNRFLTPELSDHFNGLSQAFAGGIPVNNNGIVFRSTEPAPLIAQAPMPQLPALNAAAPAPQIQNARPQRVMSQMPARSMPVRPMMSAASAGFRRF